MANLTNDFFVNVFKGLLIFEVFFSVLCVAIFFVRERPLNILRYINSALALFSVFLALVFGVIWGGIWGASDVFALGFIIFVLASALFGVLAQLSSMSFGAAEGLIVAK